MLALYRDGRQAEALAAYRQARGSWSTSSAPSPALGCASCTSGCSPPTRRWPPRRPGLPMTDGPGLMVPASWEGLSELWLLVAVPR